MGKIHPAEPSTVFWSWSSCIGDLIAWATDPDAETTSSDGWRESLKSDIRDKSDRARDAATDDVTRNQVTRSRSLASRLVRMLNETPELNATPCRNWSQVDQQVVNQLVDLQLQFAKLGDGKRPAHPAQRTKAQTPRNDSPTPVDLKNGRQVFAKMGVKNVSRDDLRDAMRKEGFKIGTTKAGLILREIKNPKK